MKRLLAVTVGLAALVGCELENSCDRLADYVCTCRDGDEDYDCEAYLALAENPSSGTLDECVLELEELRTEDELAGQECVI